MSKVINYDSAVLDLIRQYLGICMRELDSSEASTGTFNQPLALRAEKGREHVTFPARASNFDCVQTGSGGHRASYPTGTRDSFPGGKAWSYTSIPHTSSQHGT
jgi:hypothetical protein